MSELHVHIESFNAILADCQSLSCMARDSGLQRDACTELRSLLARASELKANAVAVGDEDSANLFLGFECAASSVYSELRMWLLLKEENPNEAWSALIDAQMAATSAARAHRGFMHLLHQHARLEAIEKLVFPPQVFLSAGWIVGRQECSICAAEYGTCDHLVGKPYMGRLCSIVARELQGNHVAIVKHPADKKCRVITFEVEGGKRDRMTWKIEPANRTERTKDTAATDGSATSDGLTCEVIFATGVGNAQPNHPNDESR